MATAMPPHSADPTHTGPADLPTAPTRALHGICPLPHWGVVQAQGEDAAHFLHGQLTQDVLLLQSGHARLAAYCNAKGRVLASFVLLKTAPDCVLLLMPADALAGVLKRLSMFVLRAKVKLHDATAQWQVHGLLGLDTALGAAPLGTAALDAAPLGTESLAAAAFDTRALSGGFVVALHPAQTHAGQALPRALWLRPNDNDNDSPDAAPALALADWQWAEVMSGVTLVGQALAEAFVPQMLNYESVGGVNFKKGCYPGQEVVARSQFRGTLKRRTACVHSPVALTVGAPVFSPADPDQACATVLLCAPCPDGSGFAALVSGATDSMASGWHASSAQGPALRPLPLPYPLLDDI